MEGTNALTHRMGKWIEFKTHIWDSLDTVNISIWRLREKNGFYICTTFFVHQSHTHTHIQTVFIKLISFIDDFVFHVVRTPNTMINFSAKKGNRKTHGRIIIIDRRRSTVSVEHQPRAQRARETERKIRSNDDNDSGSDGDSSSSRIEGGTQLHNSCRIFPSSI